MPGGGGSFEGNLRSEKRDDAQWVRESRGEREEREQTGGERGAGEKDRRVERWGTDRGQRPRVLDTQTGYRGSVVQLSIRRSALRD